MLGHTALSEEPLSSLPATSSSVAVTREVLSFSPQQKKQSGFADVIPNLLLTTLAAAAVFAIPIGQRLFDSAPISKKQVQVEQPINRLPLGIPPAIPAGVQEFDSAPAVKARVHSDVLPNLTLNTLAPTAAEQPVGGRLFESAPPPKYNIRAPLFPERIEAPAAAVDQPIGGRLDSSAPPPKGAVYADNWPSRLTTGIPATVTPIPIGQQVYDSAPPPKYNLRAPLFPERIEAPADAVDQPIGSRVYDSAPPLKAAVYADNWPSRLTTGIPVATVDPLPIGRGVYDSAPPPKYNLRAPLFPERIEAPAAPAEAPFGTRLDVSAPYRKYQVQVDIYQNYLPLGIPPGYPGQTDLGGAPEAIRRLSQDVYPNLSESTLFAVQPSQPVGQRLFENAPPRKFAVYADNWSSLLTTGIIPPLDQPIGQRVFENAPPLKAPVYDLNYLWPNSQLPARPAPSVTVNPTFVVQPPAGRHKKRPYVVTIDGQDFIVSSVEEARDLLNQAKALAEVKAEELAAELVPKKYQRKTGKRPVALPTPRISTPDEALKEVVAEARKAVNKIYRDAAIDAELAVRIARADEQVLIDDDDDEAITLLLM